MRIGVDAREIVGYATGVGRYLGGLLREWTRAEATHGHEIVLYAHQPIPAFSHANVRCLPGAGGTAWEQLTLGRAVANDKVDVLFSPAYSTPLTTRVPRVVALHVRVYEQTRAIGELSHHSKHDRVAVVGTDLQTANATARDACTPNQRSATDEQHLREHVLRSPRATAARCGPRRARRTTDPGASAFARSALSRRRAIGPRPGLRICPRRPRRRGGPQRRLPRRCQIDRCRTPNNEGSSMLRGGSSRSETRCVRPAGCHSR
mgnify:CR=1 FL=1